MNPTNINVPEITLGMLVVSAIILLIWILLAFLAAIMADKKGHEPVWYFVLGLATGPLAVILAALVSNKYNSYNLIAQDAVRTYVWYMREAKRSARADQRPARPRPE